MASKLMADVHNISPATQQSQRQHRVSQLDILQKPASFSVKSRERRQLLSAQPDDSVIVHAWKRNHDVAIAYDPYGNAFGEISADLLGKEDPQLETDSEIFTLVARNGFKLSSIFSAFALFGSDLQLEVGHKIRVCRWRGNKRRSGVGFNLTTGEVGSFCINSDDLDLVKDEN